MTDTGRNMTSLGLRRNRPISFTTLVKANMKVNWAQKAYCRFCRSQLPVAHQAEARRRGSKTKAKDVKVAM